MRTAAAAATGGHGGLLDYRYEHQCGSMFLAAASCPPVHPCGSRSAGEFGDGGGGRRSPAARLLSAVSETCSAAVQRWLGCREGASGRAVGRRMDTAVFVARREGGGGSIAVFRRFNPFSAEVGSFSFIRG